MTQSFIPDQIKQQVEDRLSETRKECAIELRDLYVEALLNGTIPDMTTRRAIWLVSQLRNLNVASPSVLQQLLELVRTLARPSQSKSNI
jgi:hypothetical protein